jgi:pilus assembly protein CpaE
MLATLDRTDALLLLCALDVPTLKNVRLALQTLELLTFPRDRTHVVLRRTKTKVGMNPGEVEAALERKVDFEVPADGAVPLSVNRGQPLVLSDPKTEFSRVVREMAKKVSTPTHAQKPKRRFFALGKA